MSRRQSGESGDLDKVLEIHDSFADSGALFSASSVWNKAMEALFGPKHEDENQSAETRAANAKALLEIEVRAKEGYVTHLVNLAEGRRKNNAKKKEGDQTFPGFELDIIFHFNGDRRIKKRYAVLEHALKHLANVNKNASDVNNAAAIENAEVAILLPFLQLGLTYEKAIEAHLSIKARAEEKHVSYEQAET